MVLRLKDILAVCGIIIAAAIIITVVLLINGEAKPVQGKISSARPTAIIDAGHGGVDGGAVSLSGAFESHINLEIAKKTELLFTFYGVNTVMTRTEDISIHSPEADTIRKKKVSDLKNRAALIGGYPDGILISIHQNTFTDSKYYGAQVFFRPDEKSRQLGEIAQDNLRQVLNQGNLKRKAAKVPSSVYLMKNVKNTAILTECGFLTNPNEEKLLRDNDYQLKISQALVASFMKYMSTESPQLSAEPTA